MRALTATQRAFFPLGHNATRLKVLIDNGTGSFTDLTNIGGYNFVQQATWSDSVDANGITGTVSVSREIYLLSTSPLMTQSKLNDGNALIFAGRQIQIYTATLPVDMQPQTSDWQLMAVGHVDTVDFAADPITLNFSDYIMALLVNTFIISQLTYGSPTGVALESVIQGLVNDNINTPNMWPTGNPNNIALYTPVPSTFAITPFTQGPQTMTDAVNTLAQQIGWNCRPFFNTSTGAFVLTLYSPPRTVGAPVYTFGPDDYDTITDLIISKQGIRNYICGTYTDASTQLRQTLAIQDAASLAKFGPPPMRMQISEAATSQIDSAAEMTLMLQAALADLKDPIAQQTATMPYFYALDVGDILEYLPNGKHYDSPLTGGIISYQHTVGQNESTTQVVLKGTPSGGYTRWMRMEARAGVAPGSNVRDPAAPATVAASGNVGSLTFTYVVPDIDNWSTTEVYLSTSPLPAQTQVNGKNQRPPSTYFAASARSMHITVNNLIPGTTYYAGLVVIDRDGNVGTMTTQVQQTAATVGPYQENLSGQQDQLVRNPDFDIYTLGQTSPPDAWFATNFTWASRFANNSNQASGGTCLQFANTDMPGAGYVLVTSAPFPFAALDLISVGAYINTSSTSNTASITVQYLNAAGSVIGTSVYNPGTLAAAYQNVASTVYQAPVGTRQVSLQVKLAVTSGTMQLDRIYANRGMASMYLALTAFGGNAGANEWAKLGSQAYGYWNGLLPLGSVGGTIGITLALPYPTDTTNVAHNQMGIYTIQFGGMYTMNATCMLQNNDGSTVYPGYFQFEINTGSGFTSAIQGTNSALPVAVYGEDTSVAVNIVLGGIQLAAGNQVRWSAGGGGSNGMQVANDLAWASQYNPRSFVALNQIQRTDSQ